MTEREQFEAWANGTGFNTTRNDNDNYLYSATRGAWEAWQAARAQSSTSNPVEVSTTVQTKRAPMTDAQIEHALRSEPMADNEESFALGIRHAERHHGIMGKEGGA